MVSLLKTTRRRSPFILLCLVILTIFLTKYSFILAQDSCGTDMKCWQGKIDEYTNKIQELQGQQKTLASTISLLNSKINLTLVQISKTEQEITNLEEEIDKLSDKIGILNKNLDEVAKILKERIGETYKNERVKQTYLLLSSSSFSNLVLRLNYLKTAQLNDRALIEQMKKQKEIFDEQKNTKEKKQKDLEVLRKTLEGQKITLAQQKKDKQILLEATKNSEKEYQRLLNITRAEYEAIQAIIAGRGDETKVGPVKEGEKIATVIFGDSCNSSGTHLHFMISNQGQTMNPFSYLKAVDYVNCSSCYGTGQSCPCPDADPFNPSGNWNWPIDSPVEFEQGYGNTWAVNHTWVKNIYNFHNGIDIRGSSLDVKAVKDGILYDGSYKVGCTLKYVRVEQSDGLDTYYLHVNYY